METFTRLRVAVAFSWIAAVVSASLAMVNGQWYAVVPAITACVASAGWLMAVNHWAQWRRIAEELTARLGP